MIWEEGRTRILLSRCEGELEVERLKIQSSLNKELKCSSWRNFCTPGDNTGIKKIIGRACNEI